jgi:predicted molibdopterin-dependent oxidoreductase YjgC
MSPGRRIDDGVTRPEPVELLLDGRPIEAYPGESLATALLAAGQSTFRRTPSGAPRGPVCNMGVCFDCLVRVEGLGEVRACMTRVTSGMVMTTDAR